jgi:membrane protease YdiL (CAAX protease family)
MIFSFGNVVAFVYFFGFDRFWENIEEMLGHKRQWVQWYFWVMWMIVTPLVLLLSLLAFLFTFKGSYYGYPMPQE